MNKILSKLSDLNGSVYVDSDTVLNVVLGVGLTAAVLAIAFLF